MLATLVSSFEFTADGKQIAAVLIPDGRPPMPPAPAAPDGPRSRSPTRDKNRLRTFPSLMSTTYQKQLLEWHATGQVALIDVQKGAVKKVGQPVDGPLARRLARRQVPARHADDQAVLLRRAGQQLRSVDEMWDADGKMLAKLSDRPINLGVQDDTQPPPDPPARGRRPRRREAGGKRDMAWRADGQGLTFLEQEPAPAGAAGPPARPAADAGRPRRQAQGRRRARVTRPTRSRAAAARAPERKDRLYQWLPPFDEASKKVLFESNTRMTGLRFSPDMKMLFFSERAGQNTVEYAVDLAEPAERYTLARYPPTTSTPTPAALVGTRRWAAVAAVAPAAAAAAVAAAAARCSSRPTAPACSGRAPPTTRIPSEVGPKTFIDKVAIKTGEKQRIYESDNKDVYERVSTALDIEAGRFIVARESPKEVPQQYLVQNGTRTQLTKNQDYTPDVTNAVVERITIERPDGFKFRMTVTLPPDYQKGNAAAGDLLVLSARVPGSGRVRPARSHVQQEHLPGLRDAVDGSSSSASATPSSNPTHRSSGPPGR